MFLAKLVVCGMLHSHCATLADTVMLGYHRFAVEARERLDNAAGIRRRSAWRWRYG